MPNAQGKTVYVEHVSGHHAIRMVWEQDVIEAHVPDVFHDIQAALDTAPEPLDVIVDLTRKPSIPLQTTILHCLRGPFRDKRLREWLVISHTSSASVIGNILSGVTGRKNIRWFPDEAAALGYIHERDRLTT